MKRIASYYVAISALLTSVGVSHGAEFVGLGFLSGEDDESDATAVSADGSVVVGSASSHVGTNREAFRWSRDTGMVGLGGLNHPGQNQRSVATGVSGDGAVVVGDSTIGRTKGFDVLGFRWNAEGGLAAMPDLPMGEANHNGLSVSGDGRVVVGCADRRQSDGTAFRNAFRWTEADGIVSLGSSTLCANGASEDGSVIVGTLAFDDRRDEAFRWTEQSGVVGLGELPGGDVDSSAADVSADGLVIVGRSDSDSGFEAFRWTEQDGMVGLGGLDDPNDTRSAAIAVSGDGSIIVGNERGRPFVWSHTDGMRDLHDVLVNELDLRDKLSGWTLTLVRDISDDGTTIVGSGLNPAGQREAWMAVIAELSADPADFDGNGLLDVDDIDSLVASIVGGLNEQAFDLSGDGLVDLDDLSIWLDDAATHNGFAESYLLGDANLDGTINATDLNKLAIHWEQAVARWSAGDFNADGTIDAADLNSLGQNWLQSIAMTSPTAVPEPMSHFLFGLGALIAALSRRAKGIRRFVEL